MEDKAIRYICALDPEFPEKLKYIPNPPSGIYVRGRLPDSKKPVVSIIGSRNSSEYGRGAAVFFAKELSRKGVQIVSGMARGIDGIAQMSAIEAGGESFGILGCGVDVIYPKENKKIFDSILEKGGLISEYPPGTAPMAKLFPQRNRLISAFSDILLVIEARKLSGTSITVRFAMEQGKDVFAVPGRITDSFSAGCNALLSDGAGVAASPDDILEALGLIEGSGTKGKAILTDRLKELDPKLVDIIHKLDYIPSSLNELSEKCGLSLPELSPLLLSLVLKGYAAEAAPGYYIKKIRV